MRNFKRILAILVLASVLLSAGISLATGHSHKWSEWSTIRPATCSETGLQQRTCSAEGCPQPTEVRDTPSLGHTWGGWAQTQAASCTQEGREERTCGRDPSHKESRALPRLSHIMTGWIQQKAPTCTEVGSETNKCLTCETQTQTREIPAKGHRWGEWATITVAKCGVPGEMQRICLNGCGIAPQKQATPALEHQWGEWITEKPATCDAAGSMKRICLRGCGVAPQTQALSALGHLWGKSQLMQAATCVKDGYSRQICSRDASHVLDTPIKAGGKDGLHGHSMGAWVQKSASTCSVAGKEERTCNNGCGRVEKRDLKKLPHTSDENWKTTREGSLKDTTRQATTCTVCKQEARVRTFVPKGIKHESPTYAYGALGSLVNSSLSGSQARLIYLDLTQPGKYEFPLVTEEARSVGKAIITVAPGSVMVSLEKNAETASLLRYRFWQLFPDATSVSTTRLAGDSLPFDQAVAASGDSCVVVVHMLSNYFTSGVNVQFSEAAASPSGQSYFDINAAMIESMSAGD